MHEDDKIEALIVAFMVLVVVGVLSSLVGIYSSYKNNHEIVIALNILNLVVIVLSMLHVRLSR